MVVEGRIVCRDNAPAFENSDTNNVSFYAVYSADPADPNYTYSKATPWLDLRMGVSTDGAKNFFKPGKAYRISFTEEE